MTKLKTTAHYQYRPLKTCQIIKYIATVSNLMRVGDVEAYMGHISSAMLTQIIAAGFWKCAAIHSRADQKGQYSPFFFFKFGQKLKMGGGGISSSAEYK